MAKYQSDVKRKVFFEEISPTTDTNSFEAYLSKGYRISSCHVPSHGEGYKRHAVVIFVDEANVDKLMRNRPHRIDGATVEVYRSVPDQGSLKTNKGVKNLIVSGINGRLSRSDLEKYFEKYGEINRLVFNDGDDICRIEFDDYDAVDQALLDKPYIIHRVNVELKKGDRYNQRRTESPSKKPYCIHIKNILSRFDASDLSESFNWPVENILMRATFDEQLLTECWLKDVKNEQMAQDFVKSWNNSSYFGTPIICQIEEDNLDLCKNFRVGTCSKSNEFCYWQHIKCTEYGTCSDDTCLYGHKPRVKPSMSDNGATQTYRIKITGFQARLTPQSLAQYLDYDHEKHCYVNQSHSNIGYIVNLKSRKYAQSLMKKWHEKQIEGGQKLKCQLELYISSTSNADFNPVTIPNGSGSSPSSVYTPRSSRASSVSRDDNDSSSESGIVISGSASKTVQMKSSTRNTTSFAHASSTRSIGFAPSEVVDAHSCMSVPFPSELSADGWEETEKVEGTDGKVRLIRRKTERKRLAVLKLYSTENLEAYNRELKALQILKDINNVSKLIECRAPKPYHWIVMERARGYSLRKFFNRKYRNQLSILDAVKLIQQLLNIIKNIHLQGISYENLSPDHVMIEWDYNQTSIDQAQLILINFSQAHNASDNTNSIDHSIKRSLYRPLPENIKESQSSSTIDAFGICATLFWLLTKIDPEHGYDQLPHEEDNAQQILDRQIHEAVQTANKTTKKEIGTEQLKTYLIDTFNVGFSFRDRQPWSIGNLECRLESIYELLTAPSDSNLETTEAIFQELISIRHTSTPVRATGNFLYRDLFEKAANAFSEGKKRFVESTRHQCSWSDGSCTWMNNPCSTINERQHDDILTYHLWNQGTLSTYSIIIKCVATVYNEGNVVALAVASPIGDTMNSIPISYYSKAQDYAMEFQSRFVAELKNLLKSMCQRRKAIQQYTKKILN